MADGKTNFLIVSDLHLSEGFRPEAAKWSPNEDFLSDSAFADFLRFHEAHRQNGLPWKLIIAGDGFEFLQILSLPAADADELTRRIDDLIDTEKPHPICHIVAMPEQRQKQALERLAEATQSMQEEHSDTHRVLIQQAEKLKTWGEEISSDRIWDLERITTELRILACRQDPRLSKNERCYGLGTTMPEAVWKLDRIAEGHPIFFSALAWFLDQGNSLVVMTGNHDIELFWPEVQERIRELILDAAADFCLSDPPWPTASLNITQGIEKLDTYIQDHCTFKPWIFFEPGLFYIEHGNQYELADFFTDFIYPIMPNDKKHLRLPPGSFFVRYFFNKVEETFPFADNIRPVTRFITWSFQNRFKDTIRLFRRHTSGLWKFVKVLFSRSLKDYFQDRRMARLRYVKVPLDHKVNAAEIWQSEADHIHVYTISDLAQGSLTHKHLERIEDEAFVKRATPLHKIFRFAMVGMPPLLIGLFLLLVFAGPFIWEFFVSDTFYTFFDRYLNRAIILGVFGFLLKTVLVPLIFSKENGDGAHDYLYAASNKIWEILSDPMGSETAPTVKYLVFGHTHDPDCRRIVQDPHSPWYVNTGSWLNRVDEIDIWDQLQRDFTYLEIVVDDEPEIPGLYRWNPIAAQPERIRRRIAKSAVSDD
jgi:UDP-2,3-diacylglucosamine pyrophosphatase LpxH